MLSAIYSQLYVFIMKSLKTESSSANLLGTSFTSVVAQQSVFDSSSLNLQNTCPPRVSFPINFESFNQSLLRIPHPCVLSQQKQQDLIRGNIMQRFPYLTSWVQEVVALSMEEHTALNLPLVRSTRDICLSESYHNLPTKLDFVEEQLSTNSCWNRKGQVGGT